MIYFIDIPFKENSSHKHVGSIRSVVSIMMSGVIDTTHQWSVTAHQGLAVSLTPLPIAQQNHWHRPSAVSSVNDTADHKIGDL
jgi:hypothetical protein